VHQLLREQERPAVEARADGPVREDAGMQPTLLAQPAEARAPGWPRAVVGAREPALDRPEERREARLAEPPREGRLHDAAHELGELRVAEAELVAERRAVRVLQ